MIHHHSRRRLGAGTALAAVLGCAALATPVPASAAEQRSSGGKGAAQQPPVQTAPDQVAQTTSETPTTGEATGTTVSGSKTFPQNWACRIGCVLPALSVATSCSTCTHIPT